jgi:voltage-gated potassium channel Kch
MWTRLLRIIIVGFGITGRLPIRFLHSSDIGEYNETVHQLFIDFNIVYGSVRREVLHNVKSL